MVVGDENENSTSFNDAKSKLANHFNPNNNCPLPQRIDNDPNYVPNNQPIRLPNSLSSYGPAAAGHVDNYDDETGLPALTSSSDNEPKKKTKTISVKRKRATGLGNLGNTCFMNSTLQCLAHTPPLRHYFLSGQYKNDLNVDNPLGTGGELAKEFANLLREMWLEEQPMPTSEEEEGSSSTAMVVGDDDPKDVSSSLTNGGENGIYSSSRKYSYGNGGSMHYSNNTTSSYGGGGSDVTYPRSFKTTLGKHASRFVGYDQHDSQELAIYLLDALHEDMNRIRKKPYVEKPEQGEDESDVEAAAKAWSAHKQREDSAIQENFMGLIKSRLVCPEDSCGRVSTTFDPCMYMSVPIPGSTDRQMKVTFIPLPVKGGHTTGADMIIKVCKNSTLKDLRASVAERAREAYNFTGEGLKDEDVQFADVWSNKVWAFLNDMDSSIDSIKDRDITYAYQVFPLDKVKEEVVAYKAKKEKEEQEKKQTPPSEDGNSSDNGLASRSLSPTGELDPLTKADLDIGDRWTVALEKYLSQPMTLSRLTATARATDQERSQFYVQLLRFVSKCKDCSDAKPLEEEKKSSEEDGKVTLEEASHMSKPFKNVNTPKDLAIFEYCMGKFMKMMQERKKKEKEEKNEDEEEKTKNEDGVVVQIQIRKSDTTISHYGHNPYSSSSSTKTSWKLVGDAPIVARISPTLSVSGFREMLGRRLACGALKLNSDEHHSSGDDSLPSPVLGIMNQVALSWEEKANSRFGLAALGTVTLDQLAENSKTPVFANPNDKEEKELVTEIVDDGCIIVVDWPTHLNDILDADLLSTSQEYLTAEQQKEKEDEANKKNGVSVMDCIAKYCEREQLDQDDAWYCNQCKEHVRAWKQFSMYTPPPILIVHLKRFHYSQTTHRRDKIDTLIDFPLTDLDLRGVVKHSNWDHEPIYDCYAVSNHFGGLGGGHYTAYARGDDGTWSNFDDSRVTSNVDESEVVSKAAYCLYYKRKDIVFDKDDDVRMTTDEDMDPHVINRFLMPVSPGPSPDMDNNDTMDTASQTSTTEAASYATPCGSLTGEPSMDEGNVVDDNEIFSDAEAELGQSLYSQ